MDEKELLEIIKEATSDGRTELDLSNKGLTSLPVEIWQLTNLTKLYLFRNKLTSVPKELAQLKNLTALGLDINQLTSVPKELGQLKNLVSLNLSFNELTGIPKELGQLTKLERLDLEGNPLVWPPPDVAEQGTKAVLAYLREELERRGSEDGAGSPESELGMTDAFLDFLDQKGYPRKAIGRDVRVTFGGRKRGIRLDLRVSSPTTGRVLAIVAFSKNNRDARRRASRRLAEVKGSSEQSGKIHGYVVCGGESPSDDAFDIYEAVGLETPKRVSHEDFPTFVELTSGDKGELESTIPNLSKFMKHLNDNGRRLCKRIIERAGKNDLRFKIEAPTDSYINLKISNPQRTAVQLHRWGDLRTSIALAIAGTTTEWPEPKYDQTIKKGNIETLSGYLSGNQPEIRWLKGRARGKWLQYEAETYIIEPQVLEHEGAWKELEDLLLLAKKNAEGEKEPEAKKVSKYGRGGIATIQMDRLSDVDLLGRDRLVRAFAGMFVHTEEVEGFTVALLGDWGEGKSTVMKLLKESLNENHPGRFEFATFNAWEYERTDNIAAGLAQEVVNGLIEPLQQDFRERQRLRFQFALQEYKGELWRLAIYSVVALFIVLISCIFLENNTLKGLGLAGGIAAVFFLLFKYLPTIIEHPIAIKLETYLKLPNYGKHLGDIPIIQSHLKTLC